MKYSLKKLDRSRYYEIVGVSPLSSWHKPLNHVYNIVGTIVTPATSKQTVLYGYYCAYFYIIKSSPSNFLKRDSGSAFLGGIQLRPLNKKEMEAIHRWTSTL